MLRMIAGLEEITEGDIYIDDERINDIPPKDRDIAMVLPELRPLSTHDGGKEHGVRVETSQISESGD